MPVLPVLFPLLVGGGMMALAAKQASDDGWGNEKKIARDQAFELQKIQAANPAPAATAPVVDEEAKKRDRLRAGTTENRPTVLSNTDLTSNTKFTSLLGS